MSTTGDTPPPDPRSTGPTKRERRLRRERRRRRLKRHGRRAYIRSVYFLPSLATLGNAVCGFGAMFVVAVHHDYSIAAYLLFAAMLFDAIDGRLARFARHTTDFGGQLDSLADVVSFGAAPAFIALLLFRETYPNTPAPIARLIWAVGALYLSCAALRLARFNVSNEHGEQHHFSFLGLPSPAAGGTVAAWILMQQDLSRVNADLLKSGDAPVWFARTVGHVSTTCLALLPIIVLGCGLLMVSQIRYSHLVNRYLRGRRSIGRLIAVLMILLLIIVAHQYVVALAFMVYALWGATSAVARMRRARVT